MELKITNSDACKLNILSITLLIQYCCSLYLAISNNVAGKILSVLSLALSLFHVFLYVLFNYRKKHIIAWAMTYLFLFICYRICRRREVLDLFVMISFYSKIDYGKLSRRILHVTVCFMIVTALLSWLEMIPVAPTFYRGTVVRHTFGLNHPNAVGYFVVIIAEMVFIRNYRRRSILVLCYLAALTFVPFYLSDCRTAFMVNLILLVIYGLRTIGLNLVRKIFRFRLLKILCKYAMPVIIVALLYVSNDYEKFHVLNSMLSARLENNFLFLQTYPFRLFGNSSVQTFLTWFTGWGVRYLDSGYMQLLLIFGLINTVAFIMQFVKAVSHNLKAGRTEIVLVLSLIACVLLVEAAPLHWYIASPLLFQSNHAVGSNSTDFARKA